ncbi:hypothetical protein GCM10008997_20010 [Halomonas salifodinae]
MLAAITAIWKATSRIRQRRAWVGVKSNIGAFLSVRRGEGTLGIITATARDSAYGPGGRAER